MVTKQRTLPGLGLDKTVPCRRHPDDLVECSDGTMVCHCDVCYDVQDGAHRTDEDAHDANVAIVTEILMGHDTWVTEYCTENTDHADGYSHIVNEVSHEWPERIEEWIRDKHGDLCGHTQFDDCMKALVEAVCEDIDGSFDVEPEFGSNEYAAYSGDGCCLWGTDNGEYEEQTEISSHDELQALHDDDKLDDVLDDVNCDVHVSRYRRREKNEATGHYEEVGRETYHSPCVGHDICPCLMTYHMPGGRWDFVVSAERMKEAVATAIIAMARKGGKG